MKLTGKIIYYLIKMKNKKLNDNRTLFIKLTVCRDYIYTACKVIF